MSSLMSMSMSVSIPTPIVVSMLIICHNINTFSMFQSLSPLVSSSIFISQQFNKSSSQQQAGSGGSSSFTRRINKTDSFNTVCVLVRVTPRTDKGSSNMNNINRNSNTDDFYMTPVACSYNKRNWEAVAGPYAQNLSINNCCTLVIPNLSDQSSANAKFVLMTFSHSTTDREEVSRFFQSTTFGPNLNMINSWNYNNDMKSEMNKWVKTQMNEKQTPLTSHRAYFRQRANFDMERQNANRIHRPFHPCAKNARWREYSFLTSDTGLTVAVTNWNGKYLISVDGYPRTVTDKSLWIDMYGNVTPGTRTFSFCNIESSIGGTVSFYGEIVK
jgi:hypothetical protein